MKKLIAVLLVSVFAFTSATVQAQLSPPVPDAHQQRAEPNEAQLQTHGHYKNKAGQEVHAPAKSVDGAAPDGASAKCRDGTYSVSKNHRGSCSHHGGVATWL